MLRITQLERDAKLNGHASLSQPWHSVLYSISLISRDMYALFIVFSPMKSAASKRTRLSFRSWRMSEHWVIVFTLITD
jgi:hypothetical protein